MILHALTNIGNHWKSRTINNNNDNNNNNNNKHHNNNDNNNIAKHIISSYTSNVKYIWEGCCEKHNIKLFRAQKYIENPKIGQCCYGMKLEIMGLSSIQFGAILLWTFFVVAFFVVDFFFCCGLFRCGLCIFISFIFHFIFISSHLISYLRKLSRYRLELHTYISFIYIRASYIHVNHAFIHSFSFISLYLFLAF